MKPIVIATVVKGSPGAVFKALTVPTELDRWIAARASVDLRQDGTIDFGWHRGGPTRVRAVARDKLLEYAWQYGDEPETVVRWELTDLGGATQVTVVHSGFDQGAVRDRYRQGWTRRVARLSDVVAEPDGVPLVRVSQDADIVPEAGTALDANDQGVSTVTIGGRMVRYRRGGSDGPTVVLIAGVAGDHTHFSPVFDRLALSSTVIAYDRSGYGGSDPAPAGRDGLRWQVEELADLLHALDVPLPYVIAGHGLGALIAELYSLDHPANVAAIVSINGDDGLPPPGLDVIPELPPEVEQQIVDSMFRNIPEAMKAEFFNRSPERRAAAEAESAEAPAGLARLHEAAARGQRPSVPFVHIGVIPTFEGPADLLPQPMEEVQEKLRLKHLRTASAYPAGEYVEANTGPFVQFDSPELVCAVVERLIART